MKTIPTNKSFEEMINELEDNMPKYPVYYTTGHIQYVAGDTRKKLPRKLKKKRKNNAKSSIISALLRNGFSKRDILNLFKR